MQITFIYTHTYGQKEMYGQTNIYGQTNVFGQTNILQTKNVLRTPKRFTDKKWFTDTQTFYGQKMFYWQTFSGKKHLIYKVVKQTFILQTNYTCKQAINDQQTIYRRLVVTQT